MPSEPAVKIVVPDDFPPASLGPRSGLTLPSAPQSLVQLDHGSELIPRGRGKVQLRAEELALCVEDLKLRGEPRS